jgi:hypothetical protein
VTRDVAAELLRIILVGRKGLDLLPGKIIMSWRHQFDRDLMPEIVDIAELRRHLGINRLRKKIPI